jgi:hypothetical protein
MMLDLEELALKRSPIINTTPKRTVAHCAYYTLYLTDAKSPHDHCKNAPNKMENTALDCPNAQWQKTPQNKMENAPEQFPNAHCI